MKDKSSKIKEVVTEATVPTPWTLFLQVMLLVMHYGFQINMPWWVIWFPLLYYVMILAILFIVIIVSMIISALMG